jgi:hypothetical protein
VRPVKRFGSLKEEYLYNEKQADSCLLLTCEGANNEQILQPNSMETSTLHKVALDNGDKASRVVVYECMYVCHTCLYANIKVRH